jgi:hypothetical protein
MLTLKGRHLTDFVNVIAQIQTWRWLCDRKRKRKRLLLLHLQISALSRQLHPKGFKS